MAKTDWRMGDVVHPEDMNEIGEEVNQLREDLDHIDIPPASTSEPGIVQLSNAVDSDSETTAATPKAVKTAYDRAEEAFLLGNERKEEVVDALIAIGVAASTDESWDDLISKVASVIRATGNASVGDVLSGRTFSNSSANGLTGTMPNRGAVNQMLTTQGQQFTIPEGYHNGAGTVTANISNLSAGNVRSGASVGGVAGTFSQFSNGATAAQILTGRSAAVNGAVVNGSMANRTGHVTGQSISRTGTILRIRPQAGYYPGGTDNSVQYNDPNWVEGNIVDGTTIFGKPGSAKLGTTVAVQRVGGNLTTSSSANVLNLTISPVDVDDSIVTVSTYLVTGDSEPAAFAMAELTSPTTVTVTITPDSYYRGSATVGVSCQVITFNNVRSIQKGRTLMSEDTTSNGANISTVNASRSILFFSHYFRRVASQTFTNSCVVRGNIYSNGTGVSFTRGYGKSDLTIAWSVVEFL